MKKKLTAVLLLVAVLTGLYGCGHKHDWNAATCITPKTCLECGEKEGEPLGHSYGAWEEKDKNTLGGTEIHTCSRCEKTESRVADREKAEHQTVLDETGIQMTPDALARYWLTYLPQEYYISNIQENSFRIDGRARYTVNFTEDEEPEKRRIVIMGDTILDIVNLFPYIYEATENKPDQAEIEQAQKDIREGLNNGTYGVNSGSVETEKVFYFALNVEQNGSQTMLNLGSSAFASGKS